MASINKVIIIGNLGRDPETRYLTDGSTPVTTLSVATTRRVRAQDGQTFNEETEWHRIVFFGRTAEVAKDYLHKGSSCYVEGRLRTRKYTGKDGIERYATDIIGETLQLLDRRNSDQQRVDDSFESAPRAARPAPQPRPAAPAPQPAQTPAATAQNLDDFGDDVPF